MIITSLNEVCIRKRGKKKAKRKKERKKKRKGKKITGTKNLNICFIRFYKKNKNGR